MATRWNDWRRFNLPNLLYILILVAIMVGSYWYVRQDRQAKEAPPPPNTERVDGFAQQAELSQTSKDGKLLHHATMSDIEHFGNDNLQGKNITLVTQGDRQPQVTVKAQQALWHSDTQQVELKGQVELSRAAQPNNPDSAAMYLTTDEMVVDMRSGMAHSDSAFTVQQGASVLQGKRFRYDYQLRDLSMGGVDGARIKAQIVGKPARP